MAALTLLPVVQSLVTADLCQSGSMGSSETAMVSAMVLLYPRLWSWRRRLLVTMVLVLLLGRWDLLLM